MFKKLLSLLKRGLAKIGLLKTIKKPTDLTPITISEETFKRIEFWKALYNGYHEDYHNIRYFTINGEKTRKLQSMNMPKIVAQEMASLVYNEKCSISIDDEVVSEFVKEVFKDNKFDKKFQDYIEFMFAVGGMVIKPYVEKNPIPSEKPYKILLSFITQDCFIPVSWTNDDIQEAVFVNQFQRRDKKYMHLEWHLWDYRTIDAGQNEKIYIISNQLFEQDKNNNEYIEVPLNTVFEDLEKEVVLRNIKRPLFAYFKPNTANNFDSQSPIGISIFANAIDTLKAIDTAFDSFHREFRLGKKRIIVPAHMVKTVVDENTGTLMRYFDANDETYEAFDGGEMDKYEFKDISVELRVEEHIAAINALLNILAMQTGFSMGTFSFDGKSVKTATEVISEQSKTFKSKQSHEIIIESGIRDLIHAIVTLGELYGLIDAPEAYEISVAFDDSIAEDKGAEINQQTQLVAAGLQSKKRAIMKVQGVTEEEALDILREIAEEEKMNAPDIREIQAEGAMFGVEE